MTQQKNIPKLRFPEFEGEWELKQLSDVAKIYDGTHQTPNYVKNGIPFYSVEQVTANDYTNTKFVTEEVYETERKRVVIEKGDILMTRIGDIGTSKFIDWDVKASFYVSLALIKQSNKYNSEFFSQYIRTRKFQKELWNRTIHVAFPIKINLGEIGNCKALLPSLPEQQKIASFFTAIDRKISQLKRKKTLLEQYKKGVMQMLFDVKTDNCPSLRFKDDNGQEFPKWEKIELGDLLLHKAIRNKESKVTLVLSVSNTRGFITQSEQFDNHRVASVDVSNYKIVNRNDFAYNPSRINVGSIARLTNYNEGIVSPMYVVFGLRESLNAVFFENWIDTHRFKYLVRTSCSGSVRDSLNFEDMCNFPIKLPSYPEQTKIANFLSAIDDKINHTQKQIEKAEVWKKGLMQQMFV
ncbi:MAG: restriction endonuclease subunit S [Bacteroidales bacterium]